MKKKQTSIKEIRSYIEFLEKRLNSKNYKNNATPEEFQKTKNKLSKEKLKLKLLSPNK